MAIQDPYKGFRFRVEIHGIQQAGFTECSSVGSHIEVVEYREGGDVASVRKLTGKVSYPDITLKWGIGRASGTVQPTARRVTTFPSRR